jgi:hypothetical protein
MMLYHASPVKGGGCGGDDAVLCGMTPIGQHQFFMFNEDKDDACENLSTCAQVCEMIVDSEDFALCFLDCGSSFTLYCTADVAKAHKEGYECLSSEMLPCDLAPLQDGFDSVALSLAMSSFASSSFASRSRASHSQPAFTIQGQEQNCTASVCGIAPDGTSQVLMINPKDCDQILDECETGPFDRCEELVFCAEESEVATTLLLTKYECNLDEEGDLICLDE